MKLEQAKELKYGDEVVVGSTKYTVRQELTKGGQWFIVLIKAGSRDPSDRLFFVEYIPVNNGCGTWKKFSNLITEL